MPTGYTAGVQSGEITTLKDFALCCARGFGFCITMRDDPQDKPIPEAFQPNPYHKEAWDRAEAAFTELEKMSEEEKARRCAERNRSAARSHADSVSRMKTEAARYDAMIDQVELWHCPPELDEMKKFMLQQLRDSRRHDIYESEEPSVLTPDEWFMNEINRANYDITYHMECWEKEQANVAKRNMYLRLLRESLA